MKLTLFAILTFLPCVALAQSTTNTSPDQTDQTSASGPKEWYHHHRSPEKQLAKLTTKLGLDATQQGQIKPVLVAQAEQLKSIFENTSLTKEQKHEQIKTLRESTKQQIESFLNPTQLAQFKELHPHHAQ